MRSLACVLALVVVVVGVASETVETDATVEVHPYSLEMAGEEYNEPNCVSDFVNDVGSAALKSQDPEALALMNTFIQEALQENSGKYRALGYKWRHLQKKMLKFMHTKINKSAAALAKRRERQAAFASAGPYHGLEPLEYKYMRLYQRYKRLHHAYKRGCVRNRFWLRLHKWHWRVLLAGDKRLKDLVTRYKALKHRDAGTKKRLSEQFSFAKKSAGFKSARFFRHVIALSKHGVAATAAKAKAQEAKNDALKQKAAVVASKMQDLKDLMEDAQMPEVQDMDHE